MNGTKRTASCKLEMNSHGPSVSPRVYGRPAAVNSSSVVMGEGYDTPLGRHLHPPIDRILLQALAASPRIASPHKAQWRKTNWTQLNEVAYYQLISQLRTTLPKDVPFWMLEEYWQPSEPAFALPGPRSPRRGSGRITRSVLS